MKCFLCEKEVEKVKHNAYGPLCPPCLLANSHGEPAKIKYLRQHGCVCTSPTMDHGMSNNCPSCGCWGGYEKTIMGIKMICACNSKRKSDNSGVLVQ